MLPNFIIAGAQKSGTTALHRYLSQHPDVFLAERPEYIFWVNTEVHFFDRNFEKGVGWYEAFFKQWNGEKAAGEKTPDYVYDPQVPERMHSVIPEVKLIFLFRNPVDRAYSHYWMIFKRGLETLPFAKAIRAEEERRETLQHDRLTFQRLYSYKDRGKYAEQVKRFLRYFPRSQLLFLLAEDLKENTEETVKKVLDFINADTDVTFPDLEKKHVGGMPRSHALLRLLRNDTIRSSRLLRKAIMKVNTKKGKKPPMNPETRRYLQEYFRECNKELEDITGLNVSCWRDTDGKK
ncbi:MAG: sulfotransferase family protein [Thermoplasmatota archaeon]